MNVIRKTTDTDHGDIVVDSGCILLVDPCFVPDDLVNRLTTPDALGVKRAVVVATPHSAGEYNVASEPGLLFVIDPWRDVDETGKVVDTTRWLTTE